MKKVNLLMLLMIGVMLSIAGNTVYADTPKSLMDTHGHTAIVTGKITMFRAQIQGLEIGPADDRLDAETLITLDSQPGKVFGISHHEEVAATESIVDTLREAYINNIPVTIQHGIAPGKNNLKIIWVQLGEAK
jgi:hypothetical protein